MRIRPFLLRMPFVFLLFPGCSSTDSSVIRLHTLNPARLSRFFSPGKTLSKSDYSIVDLNNDGKDDLTICANNEPIYQTPNLFIIEPQEVSQARFEKKYFGRIGVKGIYPDFNGDGWDEILLEEQFPDSILLHLVNHSGETLRTFTAAVRPAHSRGEWACTARASGYMDINGDGVKDVIIIIQTAYAYQPRAIAAWDPVANRYLWYHAVGFIPGDPVLADLNGDGGREIVLGSSAPDNGKDIMGPNSLVNGTDDAHTYITVLDSLGRLVSRQTVGKAWSKVEIFRNQRAGDSEPEFFAAFESHSTPWQPSFVSRWHPEKGFFGHRLERGVNLAGTPCFLDANRDGENDLLLIWSDGTLEIRTRTLELIRHVRFEDFVPRRVRITDLDRDGEEEILVTGEYREGFTTVMLDRKLQIQAWTGDAYMSGRPVNAGHGRPRYLLARSNMDDGTPFTLHLRKRMNPVWFAEWRSVLSGFLAGAGILGLAGWAIFRNGEIKNRRRHIDLLAASEIHPVMILDENGNVCRINARTDREMIVKEGWEGEHWKKVIHFPVWSGLENVLEEAFRNPDHPVQSELNISRRGRNEEWMTAGRWVSVSEKRRFFILRLQEITELTQSRRAVAWASMAQKLAHEVKTPLSTVMLSAQNMEMDCGEQRLDPETALKHVKRILKQVGRLRELTDAFLKFSRLEPPRKEKLDLNRLIRSWMEDNAARFGEKVQTHLQLQPELPVLSADSRQIQSVIQNLIDNALNAMKGRGVLTVSTRLVQSLPGFRNDHLARAVQVEITDTGHGISPEDRDSLFQPFFSRSPGGTGLGLVICKKIVEDHQGAIEVHSEPGTGTTMTITLPLDHS